MLLPYRGRLPAIASGAFVEKSARVIGEVSVGEEASIWFNVVVRADVNAVSIGRRTNIQDASVIHVSNRHPTVVGDEVTVGHQVTLHGCTVGNRSLIGIGAIVLDGAVVGEESMVAAGSIVAPGTHIPPRSLFVGSPARFRRHLTEDEIAHLAASAENYVRLRLDYLRG